MTVRRRRRRTRDPRQAQAVGGPRSAWYYLWFGLAYFLATGSAAFAVLMVWGGRGRAYTTVFAFSLAAFMTAVATGLEWGKNRRRR